MSERISFYLIPSAKQVDAVKLTEGIGFELVILGLVPAELDVFLLVCRRQSRKPVNDALHTVGICHSLYGQQRLFTARQINFRSSNHFFTNPNNL